MTAPKNKSIKEIRNEIDQAIFNVDFKDYNDYIILNIEILNLNLKAYQRNRAGSTHTYDPLSSYKSVLHNKLDPLILKYINKPLEGYCYFEIERYLKWPKNTSQIKQQAAKGKLYRPTKKPDNDNVEKLLYDMFNKIIYVDDSQIVENTTKKFYDENDNTFIKIKIYKEEFKIKRGKKK